jgi:hypothetical protein
MTFDELLAEVIALLQRQGRVSYRALKLRFTLDDDYLDGKTRLSRRSAWRSMRRAESWCGLARLSPRQRRSRQLFPSLCHQQSPLRRHLHQSRLVLPLPNAGSSP